MAALRSAFIWTQILGTQAASQSKYPAAQTRISAFAAGKNLLLGKSGRNFMVDYGGADNLVLPLAQAARVHESTGRADGRVQAPIVE